MLNKKALAGTPSTPPVFVEDVFSTYLWDGNSTARSIVNGIDLATKGGLVWAKYRNTTASNRLYDTNRGATKQIFSDLTNAEQVAAQSLTAFNTDGFSLGTGQPNENTATVVGWTFRKQAKFFDVVTYTGDGSAPRAISHNLGSTPGMITIKKTSSTGDWWVYHRSAPNQGAAYPGIGGNLYLNYADAADSGTNPALSAVSSTTFTLSTNQNAATNANGATYVAYLFAHDAGGFGTSGTDNIITCGSFTTDANGNATVNLGYEPQYLMYKSTSAAGSWIILDTMRAFCATADSSSRLAAQSSSGESTGLGGSPSATGFYGDNANMFAASNTTYIYMVIRRPMKVPTDATTVFSAVSRTGTSANATVTANIFPVDMVLETSRNANFGTAPNAFDRLRGANRILITSTTGAEVDTTSTPTLTGFDVQNGYKLGDDAGGYGINYSPYVFINWNFKRASGFFDVVCYTGTGGLLTLDHNLGVVPELLILKARGTNSFGTSNNWFVYCGLLSGTPTNKYLRLNANSAETSNTNVFGNTPFTTTTFGAGGAAQMDAGVNAVAYLFATLAGVSKVGSYTGTGATQTINCGFTAGARFVLIKRTDSTGDWYVWDTARGIVSGNDPYLLLNSTAAEVTSTDYIDPVSSGFEISSTAPAAINANGGSFIFMAIA